MTTPHMTSSVALYGPLSHIEDAYDLADLGDLVMETLLGSDALDPTVHITRHPEDDTLEIEFEVAVPDEKGSIEDGAVYVMTLLRTLLHTLGESTAGFETVIDEFRKDVRFRESRGEGRALTAA